MSLNASSILLAKIYKDKISITWATFGFGLGV